MAQTELPTLRGVLRHGIYLQEKKLLEEGVDRMNYSIKQLNMDVTIEVQCSVQTPSHIHVVMRSSPAQSQGVRDVRRGHTCWTVTVGKRRGF